MVRHDVTETLADSDRRDTESNTLSVRMVGRNSVRESQFPVDHEVEPRYSTLIERIELDRNHVAAFLSKV